MLYTLCVSIGACNFVTANERLKVRAAELDKTTDASMSIEPHRPEFHPKRNPRFPELRTSRNDLALVPLRVTPDEPHLRDVNTLVC
jgi:hypothetical protein